MSISFSTNGLDKGNYGNSTFVIEVSGKHIIPEGKVREIKSRSNAS
ncbi:MULTISPECIES: hypothetical protein [Vibrio]|uniref:Uncharacterized protein n=1 Tax=Vibrio genomosp. F6 TaxID=723172 RepID=A0A0H3ZSX8_9VIBR|nr:MULTISPECIES: hypothetical protein [Vibrio]AKN39488.1 hypothetical protein [Vibrio genomosp. F6]MDN3697531.1 hypothetical protein [Vibrio cortegadensis]